MALSNGSMSITVDAEAQACAIVLAREGFDTRDLNEAKALLEVKRRAVHRGVRHARS
jgi:hypothetical protein